MSRIEEIEGVWCPGYLLGPKCDDEGIFTYPRCCGNLNKECCDEFKTWTIITFPLLLVIFVIFLTYFFYNKLKKSRESMSIPVMQPPRSGYTQGLRTGRPEAI